MSKRAERAQPPPRTPGEFAPYPFRGFAVELAAAFANVDAVVDFSGRRGGMLAPCEMEAYYAVFSGSFALEALAYIMHRFPLSRNLLVVDKGNAEAQYTGQSGIGSLPAWVPPLAVGAGGAGAAISRRFGEGVDLVVCDLGFDLLDIELALSDKGMLIAVCAPDPGPQEVSNIADVVSRFEEWLFFHPFAFMGLRAVLCARKPHVGGPRPVDARAVAAEIDGVVAGWAESEPGLWWDRNIFDHERCKLAWNFL